MSFGSRGIWIKCISVGILKKSYRFFKLYHTNVVKKILSFICSNSNTFSYLNYRGGKYSITKFNNG